MIESKKINAITAVLVILALITSMVMVAVGKEQKISVINKLGTGTEAEYATKIFGTDIISIEIIADEKEWQQMLDNAINEQFIMADVIVNGTKFEYVGVRPKGNSSLTQVVNSDSDRYSFRLQFDEYIKGQTCFGLESFVVNNMIGDNTYMKEQVSYELMREIGVEAPYTGYADMKVNGEDWGLYLAVELYNSSYEERVFGDTSGMLYNVKSMDMNDQNGMGKGMVPPEGMNNGERPMNPSEGRNNGEPPMTLPDGANEGDMPMPLTDELGEGDMPMPSSDMVNGDGKQFGEKFGGRGGKGNSGGSLEYVDDSTDSYSAIFENVVGKGSKEDFKRVIKALKKLSEGEELEEYFDVDQILRYLAAHTIVVNLDSYSSNMAQNYYLYEKDGKVTVLPWDYNLAWGGFQSGSASSVINFPIDTPVSGVEMSSRPLIEKLFTNTEYLERYHSYLQQLLDNYFREGKFEERINTLDALIADYVKNDKTAFCTYEDYKKAVATFITLGNLRGESVQGQLDGTIPTTTEGQKLDATQLIVAEDLNISDLGTMMGGRGERDQIKRKER